MLSSLRQRVNIDPNWVRIMVKQDMSSILRNPRYEIYAQCRSKGMLCAEAAETAGFKRSHGSALERRLEIQRRIKQLLHGSLVRSELSRKDILERIFDDWELARKLGQASAALKAGELMGREMHRMFTERKEIGAPGDFDNKSEEELREIITKEMKDLGWDNPTPEDLNPEKTIN